ncbi:hypothetical protein D3C81_1234650 [compost metagenome]
MVTIVGIYIKFEVIEGGISDFGGYTFRQQHILDAKSFKMLQRVISAQYSRLIYNSRFIGGLRQLVGKLDGIDQIHGRHIL